MAFLTRLLAAAAALASVAAGEHIQAKIRNGELASRSVNLGGWLLSEHWMCFTSPLYKGVPDNIGPQGEYAVMKYLGKKQGDKQFDDHWSTFITEEDVAQIAKYGFNTLRVSTGFWIINDEDKTDQSELTLTYPSGGLKYLDKLVNEWGVKYNLAVMVSLHAHRGSQNGFDHSAPAKMGETTWSTDPANVQSSLNYAKFIAHRYKDSPAFLGLNLMNEPNRPTDYDVLKKYYLDAYKAIRADGNDCIIVTSPWLENQGPPTMMDFMTCPDYYNVWHEFHIYYKWGWENIKDVNTVLEFAGNYSKWHFDNWDGNPIFLGEWSLATIDEIEMTVPQLKKYAALQMKEAEKAKAGWAFWAWRHDEETKKNPSGWSLRQLMKQGIVEVPTTVPTRTRGPKCTGQTTPKNLATLDGSGSSSVDVVPKNITSSGSGSSAQSSSSLPGEVEIPETETPLPKTTTAPAPTPAPKTTTSAAYSLPSFTAACITTASAALAWTAL